jgi:hypothetical protein
VLARARTDECPDRTRPGHRDLPRQRPTLPRRYQRSTIGPGGLNCRVRDGNGCGPSGIATGNRRIIEHDDARHESHANMNLTRTADQIERGQAARPISTARLNASRRLHLRPINLVIFQGPSEGLRPGRSHLEAGFALRCLQRLSLPDIATQRCSWRNSWHTSGPSTPVLSY